jgi:hypothetical protein
MPTSTAEHGLRLTLRGGFFRALASSPRLLPLALVFVVPSVAVASLRDPMVESLAEGALLNAVLQELLLELAAMALLPSAIAALRGERPAIGAGLLLFFRRTPALLLALLVRWILLAIGFLALWVPGLLLMASSLLVAPLVLLERRGLVDAFRRSDQRVVGSFGRVLMGVLCLSLLAPDSTTPLGGPYRALPLELHWLLSGVGALLWACFYASAFLRLHDVSPSATAPAAGAPGLAQPRPLD